MMRYPWTVQEQNKLVEIYMEQKSRKPQSATWETIAQKMEELGHYRTADQYRSKYDVLIGREKRSLQKETSNQSDGAHFRPLLKVSSKIKSSVLEEVEKRSSAIEEVELADSEKEEQIPRPLPQHSPKLRASVPEDVEKASSPMEEIKITPDSDKEKQGSRPFPQKTTRTRASSLEKVEKVPTPFEKIEAVPHLDTEEHIAEKDIKAWRREEEESLTVDAEGNVLPELLDYNGDHPIADHTVYEEELLSSPKIESREPLDGHDLKYLMDKDDEALNSCL